VQVAEAALAHKVENEVEQEYRRAQRWRSGANSWKGVASQY
jgi:hypothetical protein